MDVMRIVVVGHGELPEALLSAARMIGGELPDVDAVGLSPQLSPEGYRPLLAAALDRTNGPVLVLSDLRGGTPDNVARLLAGRRPNTVVVSNASLAMLLELALGAQRFDLDSLRSACDDCRPVLTQTPMTRPTDRPAVPTARREAP